MPRYFEGALVPPKGRFAVCVARFNSFVTEPLLKGSLDALARHGVRDEDVDVFRVPGAFELPALARRLADRGEHAGIICLGAVIRGGTPHFEYVAAEVAHGIASVASSTTSCTVTFGVLTCDTVEQAVDRAGGKAGNKGAEATTACLEMVNLYAGMSQSSARGKLAAMVDKKK